MHVPQVPDVPEVPKDVPDVPMVSEFVWQTYYTCQTIYVDLLQEKFFNNVLTNKLHLPNNICGSPSGKIL
jgi:hypothetical protein